ncbi:plexin domain-containing protein 2-like isoform X2 [Lineus longissimus]|uniref:plexin domain-containing protein 2-like isoform X2 n=1 Tax=Lineus longissimus TaxID=88925 RepID=UPI00315D430E
MAARNLSQGFYLIGLIVLYTIIQALGLTKGFEETKSPYYSNLERSQGGVHLDYRDIHLLRLKRAAQDPDVAPTGGNVGNVNGVTNVTATAATTRSTIPTAEVKTLPPSTKLPASTPPTTVEQTTNPPTTTPRPTTTKPTGAPPTTAKSKPEGTTEPITVVENNHKYYQSVIIKNEEEAQKLWIDPYSMENKDKGHKVVQHSILSDSHRTAATVPISFNFLFYGHLVSKITIATGGFLYMSKFLHQWLTATQYIAPLMANFDSTLGTASDIHYIDNGTLFLVQWHNIHLKDEAGKDGNETGPFTFQTAIREDGLIIFNYKQVPKAISDISRTEHPVKVGTADAYYIDTLIRSDLRRRTIYEYHRVEIDQNMIKNNTAVKIIPYLTCIQQSGCESCFMSNITNFSCRWCPKLKRCSDGMDRHRQTWLSKGCSSSAVNDSSFCTKHHTLKPTEISEKTSKRPTSPPHKEQTSHHEGCKEDLANCPSKAGRAGAGLTVGIIIAIFLIVLLVVGVVGWFWYAYKNPTTRSGMWLMEHRPSQLKMKMKFWKRGGEGGEKYQVSVENSGNESVA